MFPQSFASGRILRCAARILSPGIIASLSFETVFAQDAQRAQPIELPMISVTAPPPASPSNQSPTDATVVSPTTIVTPSLQSASSVTVITAADIQQKQFRTVPDALSDVPGLNIVQSGGAGAQTSVFIRGTNANHVKVLVDGIDVSDPSNPNGSFDFGHLLTGDIARIEVLRGPQSGLYGSDAIGGVVSIITKRGEGPPRITAQFDGGSFGTTNERVGVSGGQERIDYVFNIQHLQSSSTPVTPLYDIPPGGHRNNDFYDNWTYSTKLGFKATETVGINLVGRYTEAKHRLTNDDFVHFFPLSFAEPLQSIQINHQGFVRGELVWAPFAEFKNFFGANYTNAWTYFFDPNMDTGLTSPLILPPSVSLGTRLKYDYRGEVQFLPGQLLLFGAEDQNETLRTNSSSIIDVFGNETFFTTKASRRNDAGWVELQANIAQQLFVVSNVRYDANEQFGDHTTWRIGPVFITPWTDTKLKATYGTGFRAPSLEDLYVNFLPFFVANPHLQPEKSKGWDAGFEQPIANGRIRLGATYFHNNITDLITIAPASTLFVSTLENVNVASTFGTEAFAAVSVTDNFNVRADYTYTVAKNDLTDQVLLRRPRNKASLTTTWQATERLFLSSTLLYVGSWLDMNRAFTHEVKAPAFMTVNLAANYVISDNLTIFARIENLFNKHYEDPIGFLRPGFGIFGGIRFTIGTPRGSGLVSQSAGASPVVGGTSPKSQGVL
jgi:vitamin B12 transporter